MIFSDSFLSLAEKLGIDVWKRYEEKYLLFRDTKSVYIKYNTGKGYLPPYTILNYYNDMKTKPSLDTVREAKNLVSSITQGHSSESEKVRAIMRWVNEHATYMTDSDVWGSKEYWSSPFDLFQTYLDEGTFYDDCDGWAVLAYWFCRLAGVPKQRIYVWAGNCRLDDGRYPYGHCSLIYDPLDKSGMFHIEGSLYPKDNNRRWLRYRFGSSSRYPDTWFAFNESEIVRLA